MFVARRRGVASAKSGRTESASVASANADMVPLVDCVLWMKSELLAVLSSTVSRVFMDAPKPLGGNGTASSRAALPACVVAPHDALRATALRRE